jgi:outer membrane protein assembly factor BamE (lipoprotein component of BamABCDE complex)
VTQVLSRRGAGSAILALLLATQLGGCVRTVSERGVPPTWRSMSEDSLVRGETTRAELLALLGPPSQVITHGAGEIFYYLHEEASTRGLILVVYNTSETDTRYDRAIFFFDAQGVLQDYAVRDGSGRGEVE